MTTTNAEYTMAVDEGRWPTESTVPLDAPFVNGNGFIRNLVAKPIHHVSHIFSHKGSVRANHWHKTDAHYAYVVRGKVMYFERAIGAAEIPEPKVYVAGEQFFTPPNREHAMLFLADTDLITSARNVRLHDEHEADVVRVEFITPAIAREYVR